MRRRQRPGDGAHASRGEELNVAEWRAIFEAADRGLALPSQERARFIEQYAAAHPARAQELRAMLSDAPVRSVLDDTAAALAGPLLDHIVRAEHFEPPQSGFGPYRILSEIGRGGMGAVYLAERSDDQYRKQVALKLLPAGSAGDRRQVQRFLDERQILAALDHPDIARLMDGGITADGIPWFALEYVEGMPIDRYCDENALSIAQRLKLFCRICGAVQYAHRNLVVHCDLKPANILVTPEGRVRLLDFGVAKLLSGHGTAEPIVSGERILTPLYASPEQIRGEPVSTASDVYSLGVLLSVLLTGHTPGTTHATSDPAMTWIAAARGTTPDRLRRRLAGDLHAIVLKAVENEPAHRYATAQQLETDIRRHLDGLSIVARPDTRFEAVRRFVRRHRAGVAAAGTIAILVLTFGIASTIQSVRIRSQAERITLERDRAEQVSVFLSKMFKTADPTTLRVGVTAQAILDSAAARMDGELFAEPALKDGLMFEMAEAYQRLGFPGRARVLLERAVSFRRNAQPPRELELASALHLLGVVLLEEGDAAAAQDAFSEALLLRRRSPAADHADVSRSLTGVAAALRMQRLLPEAERLAREAMALDRDRPADLARSTAGLAAVLLERGDHRAAADAFRRTLELARDVHTEEHAEVASATFGLAAALNGTGDHAAADSLMTHALRLHQRILLSPTLPLLAGAGVPTSPVGADVGTITVTPDGAGDVAPPVDTLVHGSPEIVFVSDRDSPDAMGDLGTQAIYVMAADGTGQRRLTHYNAPAGFPAWSPDGSQIAFNLMEDGQPTVVVMRADGSEHRRVIDAARLGVGAERPSWSPDGKRLAFQSRVRSDIYVIGTNGRGLKNLTNHPALDQYPAWSPDGRRIAFSSDRDGDFEIYVMDVDGRNLVRLTFSPERDQRPAWSPNGRQITFQSERDGDQEIYVMNADGSDPVRLTRNPGVDGMASWSPDGNFIIFHRRVFGHGQIHVMNADGTGVRRLTEPSGDAFNGFPGWRPRR